VTVKITGRRADPGDFGSNLGDLCSKKGGSGMLVIYDAGGGFPPEGAEVLKYIY
jgi:hypothetical protein